MSYATNPKLSQVTTSGPPLCKNCKHVRRSFFDRLLGMGWHSPRCAKIPLHGGHELVTGGPMRFNQMSFCSVERNFRFDPLNPCGSTGKLFEPRNA